MSILVFQHESHEGPCALGRVLQSYGHRLRICALDAGDPVPPDLDNVDAIISMGGAMNVDEADQYPWMQRQIDYLCAAHEANIPIVGVCLGAQLIAAALGGRVGPMPKPEVGFFNVQLTFPGTVDGLYAGIGWDTIQFHVHGQQVIDLPPGTTMLARSQGCPHQAFRVGLTTYGFQYHFEWDDREMADMVTDGLARQAGYTADRLADETDRHYDDYRRLGDRLCENIASYLIPPDTR